MVSEADVDFQWTVQGIEGSDEKNVAKGEDCESIRWNMKEVLNAVNDVAISRMNVKDNIGVEKNETMVTENVSDCKIEGKSPDVWIRTTCTELSGMAVCQLKDTLSNLKVVVEDVSSELVKLLQERQALQEEADVRNIAIEQLLKVYEKFGWKLNDTITIQMSVLPQPPEKTIDCT